MLNLKIIKINTDFITLGQFLKIENLIDSGGAAKFYLQENHVYINNQLDQRRGRKIYPSDIVKIDQIEYQIINNEN